MEANAECKGPISGVFYPQRVVERISLQTEGGLQTEGEGPFFQGSRAGNQLQSQHIALTTHHSMLKPTGKAVDLALIDLAVYGKLSLGQYTCVREQNGRLPSPNCRITLPNMLRAIFFAYYTAKLCAKRIDGYFQFLVLNGIFHKGSPLK